MIIHNFTPAEKKASHAWRIMGEASERWVRVDYTKAMGSAQYDALQEALDSLRPRIAFEYELSREGKSLTLSFPPTTKVQNLLAMLTPNYQNRMRGELEAAFLPTSAVTGFYVKYKSERDGPDGGTLSAKPRSRAAQVGGARSGHDYVARSPLDHAVDDRTKQHSR